ncbi:MAG: heavy metal translocating P-type ATPase metal-binding domain-containing protein [Brumimicrobium sp.]
MECYHCGDKIIGKPIKGHDKEFCCTGCLSVYEILSDNDLEQFYEFNEKSGVKPSTSENSRYTPLNVPEIFEEFIEFQNEDIYIVTFFLPAIHCSSCIYLLENLQKLNTDIIASEANFTARTLKLTVKKGRKLSEVAALLESIGYKPELRKQKEAKSSYDKKLLLQLGIAGFAFGSTMLWTFPEYLGLDETFEPFRNFSAYLTLLVAIPVFFYSASSYLKSAYTAIRTKQLNLDIPIALGIIVLFVKSTFSILSQEGFGYMDSFTGFVFFLLIGKWFQSKTYRSMSFENDPKAYFPLGVHRIIGDKEDIVLIDKLVEADRIKVFNEEIIPCDSELLSDKVVIDTSFITGESELVNMRKGDKIYAGSKLIGSSIHLKVLKTTDSSRFADIWNKSTKRETSFIENRENRLSKYFLIIVSILSVAGAITWWFIDPSRILEVVTAILVVACPCALALSFPFVYGNAMRKFGRNGLYFRNSEEIKKLTDIDHIVFDKTGTLTKDRTEGVIYEGEPLSAEQKSALFELTRQSTHPYSKSITQFLADDIAVLASISDFQEVTGKGVQAINEKGEHLKLGSASFVGLKAERTVSGSYFAIDGEIIGSFSFQSQLRNNILQTISDLQKDFKITLLSGDHASDAKLFDELEHPISMHFNQSPTDKRDKIQALSNKGNKTVYVGDGLNDSEALKSAHLGISVAEDEFRFTPSSDAIIKSDQIQNLAAFFKFGKYASTALRICLYFSLLYNTVGITFAFMGYVTPLFAAILMPLSSITIVFLSTALIRMYRVK